MVKLLTMLAAAVVVAALALPIPTEAAHDSGVMAPTHSEMISPAVPK